MGCKGIRRIGLLLVVLLLGWGNIAFSGCLFEPGEQTSYAVGEQIFFLRLAPAATFPTGMALINKAGEMTIQTDQVNDSYWIGETPVTYALWLQVYLWAIDHGYIFSNPGQEGSEGEEGAAPTYRKTEPVTMVSWHDTIIWCNALSERLGYEPVYRYEGKILRDASQEEVLDQTEQWDKDGFRLPTKGEWELAARYIGPIQPELEPLQSEALFIDGLYWIPGNYASGATAPSWIGCWRDGAPGDAEATNAAAWYWEAHGGSAYKTMPVGEKPPYGNELGLYDMSGNVWEWCFDWYSSSTGSLRLAQGGGWENHPHMIQVGQDIDFNTFSAYHYLGFRLARNAP